MRHKMITLCPTSYEIAQKMDNFSSWVRKKLLEDIVVIEEGHIFHRYQCPVCKRHWKQNKRIARSCDYCKYPMKYLGVVE